MAHMAPRSSQMRFQHEASGASRLRRLGGLLRRNLRSSSAIWCLRNRMSASFSRTSSRNRRSCLSGAIRNNRLSSLSSSMVAQRPHGQSPQAIQAAHADQLFHACQAVRHAVARRSAANAGRRRTAAG